MSLWYNAPPQSITSRLVRQHGAPYPLASALARPPVCCALQEWCRLYDTPEWAVDDPEVERLYKQRRFFNTLFAPTHQLRYLAGGGWLAVRRERGLG